MPMPRPAGTRAPMKRGLKRTSQTARYRSYQRWNTCPDEEGTETYRLKAHWRESHAAGTRAPMKRGLKRTWKVVVLAVVSAGTRAPMKRGLKPFSWWWLLLVILLLEHVPR